MSKKRKWVDGYLYINVLDFRNYLRAEYPAKDDNGDIIPNKWSVPKFVHIDRKNILWPMEQDGVDDDGNPVYKRIQGRRDVLILMSVRNAKGKKVKKKLKKDLPTLIDVSSDMSQLRIDYPDHTVGQVIPHIAKIRATA